MTLSPLHLVVNWPVFTIYRCVCVCVFVCIYLHTDAGENIIFGGGGNYCYDLDRCWCGWWRRTERRASSVPPPSQSSAITRGREGESRDQRQRAPRCYSPDGRRFTVSGRHVTWLNWKFYFNIRTTTGPVFHDIRFRGQRIVYELALQVS